jgi:hypothetical protein
MYNANWITPYYSDSFRRELWMLGSYLDPPSDKSDIEHGVRQCLLNTAANKL